VASTLLVEEVRRRIVAAGWRPVSVDLTVIAARPRLGAHLEPMRHAIAGLLRLDPGAVNVKASSGNLDGSEGAGRSVSAIVIATVEADR
jgi:2-C-methyl-D-erythritol 2,4-cyclodiphosphate synthase